MALGREDDHQYAGSTTGLPYSYVPIPNGHIEDQRRGLGNKIHDGETTEDGEKQNRARFAFALLSMVMLAAFVVAVVGINHKSGGGGGDGVVKILPNVDVGNGHEETLGLVMSRGKAEGVSEKTNRVRVGNGHHRLGAWVFDWKKSVLDWQRTGFHFQPKSNWMNDPNGPLLYKGWYHFFYQYNPNGAVWGDIVWGHAASRDLINWLHLPIAMVPDKWYDKNGVWTGSATIIPSTESGDSRVVMLYTGSTNESVQVQNLAVPADQSDPLLVKWVKYPGNPVLFPPKGIDKLDFRDPTTAWLTKDGKWRISIGSKRNRTGISLMYDTKDFIHFELIEEEMHGVEGTGMWECVDFYPVSVKERNGVDMSTSVIESSDHVKHVLKASMDDDRNDYYALGSYEDKTGKWVPDNAGIDVGIGLRYDYGKFYASKTFYDAEKKRRVLWGWVPEGDSEYADIEKGWSSLQAIPRTVLYDQKTGENLITWPVEEVESLRSSSKEFKNVKVEPGTVVPLQLGNGNGDGDASQIDIVAEFEIDYEKLPASVMSDEEEEYRCDTSGGAAQRGAIGPFGFMVLTDEEQTEQTPVYFYLQKKRNGGGLNTFICSDLSRSSAALDVTKGIYGSTVPVLTGEKLSLRILVDHSIVEAFAQEGRTCITSRVYPTKAIYQHAKLFLFNNATHVSVTASVKAWRMTPARYAQDF